MINAKKGDWVQIHRIVLKPEERASHLPEDTRLVPLELWVKGELLQDAAAGETVKIKTATGRIVSGSLVTANPRYTHDYGNFVPELKKAGDTAKQILFGGEK